MSELVAYFRVSTVGQGDSGLGLEAQREAVEAFARHVGGRIKASYTEVESGGRSDRPQLAKAIAHARRSKARLVVAKLDRLSRNLAFLAALMEAKVEFVCVDNPHANNLTIHILAAVAEDELVRIKQRTKAALAALKARGVPLGSARPGHWEGREELRRAGLGRAVLAASASRIKEAAGAYADLAPEMAANREAGMSLAGIAARLNAEGHTTRRGRPWNAMQVLRVIKRGCRR